LLAWFDREKRDLPWRHMRDPYRIWVSEVMLQQTQVATVIPYYERFLKAFPDLRTLAASREAQVLRLWEGLGYYRRARDLHRAAKVMVNDHGGRLPEEPAVFSQLPGVGRYMLGAVLSQAFDQRLPILEANSLRVLCRLFARRGDPRKGRVNRWLWQVVEHLLPTRRIGDFNQALMELGALVCTPRQPRCERCPLAKFCAACKQGLQRSIPRPARPKVTTELKEVAVVPWRGDKVLLVQRPPQGRWAGMWEFPHGELEKGETFAGAARRILRQRTALTGRLGTELAVIRHGITRFRITIAAFEARQVRGRFRSEFYTAGRWLSPGRLRSYPLSTPQRRLARLLAD
jgi:A/G-specific adenine glycosylase